MYDEEAIIAMYNFIQDNCDKYRKLYFLTNKVGKVSASDLPHIVFDNFFGQGRYVQIAPGFVEMNVCMNKKVVDGEVDWTYTHIEDSIVKEIYNKIEEVGNERF